MAKKTTQLRRMLSSHELEFIMEAHNGLSAKIAEEAGFRGIWASGLSISASLGVRDNNEASWTQVLEVLEFMSDASSIPILVDGDTGYGNFNNARRLVRKLEQRDIAGVCVEDKLFPKTNSFISGEAQPLADVDEFCGKIKAMKDSQTDPDFSVVARVEAFIAGWGLDEALRRAEAYRKAGADAVLIHSKRSDYSEIAAFMKAWADRLPVVIVPTKYYSTPTETIRDSGVRLVIWANHNLRSAITAMKETSKRIFAEQSLVGIEDKVATVSEVFRLQGAEELEEAEKKYLPTSGKTVNAVILAAARGEKLGELTVDTPKTMLEINGRPILTQMVEKLNRVGIKDISVVRGFAKAKVNLTNLKYIDNDLFAESSEVYSLFLARDRIAENTVIVYGDIIFRGYFLNDLLNDDSPITIIVDADMQRDGHYHDFVACDRPDSRIYFEQPAQLIKMSHALPPDATKGEFIGLLKVNATGAAAMKKLLEEAERNGEAKAMRMDEFMTRLVGRVPIGVKYVRGSWVDINSFVDFKKALDEDTGAGGA
jgi:phosphoenolpyruvate phosphomutase